MQIQREIKALENQLIEWRRAFHQHPESSLKEYETANYIRQQLKDLGISYQEVGETGTLGVIEGRKVPADNPANRQIILRADIDALEIQEATEHDFPSLNQGRMHACGHDAHTTALLGAARYLKENQHLFSGKILLAFQQAEEIGAGAKQFVASGLIDEATQVFGMHVDPLLNIGQVQAVAGPQNASCDIFTIEVHGKSAHVAEPHLGVDALVIGANIVSKIQQISARQANPLEPVIVGIGRFQSGTRYNIIANHAKIEGTLRCLSHESREAFLARIEQIAQLEGELHGASVRFENYDAAAPVINHEKPALRAQAVAAKIVGPDKVIRQAAPSMGADDFADYLAEIPGVYVRVGVCSSEKTSYGLHHEKFDLDEKALPLMVQLHVDYALDYLNN